MRLLPLAAAVAALLVPAAPAFAGDPIMPLSQVSAGMQCTGYSVIQGTAISSFDVQVLDVAGGEATGSQARILFRASGPAVDATGLGPGFSGSPIYCPDAAGVMRNIGAVSESINEYGGLVALATPIEAILGTPVDVPRRAPSTRMKAAMAKAKPMASPLTVSGLSAPLAQRARSRRREGRAARACRAPRAAGGVPRADAAAGLRGRGRVLVGRRARERGRDRRLRRRRSRVGLRPSARGRRPAGAAAAGRLRLPDRQQPAAAGVDRGHLQVRGLRA